MTAAPAAASARAAPSPRPRLAPVTRATFPFNSLDTRPPASDRIAGRDISPGLPGATRGNDHHARRPIRAADQHLFHDRARRLRRRLRRRAVGGAWRCRPSRPGHRGRSRLRAGPCGAGACALPHGRCRGRTGIRGTRARTRCCRHAARAKPYRCARPLHRRQAGRVLRGDARPSRPASARRHGRGAGHRRVRPDRLQRPAGSRTRAGRFPRGVASPSGRRLVVPGGLRLRSGGGRPARRGLRPDRAQHGRKPEATRMAPTSRRMCSTSAARIAPRSTISTPGCPPIRARA